MNNKLTGLISEKELNDLTLKNYKDNLNMIADKEKALSQMPYSSEYPR